MSELAVDKEDRSRRKRSPDKKTMKRRWKAATLALASVCIRTTGNFALSHSDDIHRSRWKEITAFANARYPIQMCRRKVMLTVSQQIQTPIPEPQFIADSSGLSFFVASMAFVALASVYHQATCCDNRQDLIVFCVSIAGLVLVWRLDVGILVGLYCIETWFVLLGLVVSDISQAACQRWTRPREIEQEQTTTGLETKRQGSLASPV